MATNSTSRGKLRWLKPGVMAGALVPLCVLALRAYRHTLGADPVAIALNQLGLLALIFLVATLAATPAKLLLDLNWPLRIRKLLGLLSFLYASLHFLLYAVIDQGLAWSRIAKDVLERRFISVGFCAFVILVPLAITSPNRVRKRLGNARWTQLHRLVYLAAILAAVHFIWRVKRDLSQPLAYALVLATLLAVRLLPARGRKARGASTA